MAELAIRRLASGGVITNYHCVSRCGHCLYNCSPKRSKDYLDPVAAEAVFERIAQMGCRSVHIGGGEPLLEPARLKQILDCARSAGVGIDYIETNCAWYQDPERAAAVLTPLRAAGLRTLLVSISPFHNAFIPFARVRGVIEACRQVGLQVFPWVNAFVSDLSCLDQHRPHPMAEFETVFGVNYLKRIRDRYWIHLGGRALATFRKVFPIYPPEHILADCPLSCARALTDTSHFHIDLFGNYIPGLCAGLAIDMQDLGKPLDAARYPLLTRLAAGGLRGLYAHAKEFFGYGPSRGAFLNHCDLCTDIRQFLFDETDILFPELAPREFYVELSEGTFI